ncbi:MAG: NADH-quinone oxidoreductase subunit A [Thermogutta sp.]
MEFDAALIPFTLFLAALVGLSVGLILLGHLCGPHRSNPVKSMPYESGMDPFHDAHRKFHVRFHVLAIAFVIFDVELLFLYPWVLSLRQSSTTRQGSSVVAFQPTRESHTTVASLSMVPETNSNYSENAKQIGHVGGAPSMGQILWPGLVFFILLGLGYIYDWRRRIFDWN